MFHVKRTLPGLLNPPENIRSALREIGVTITETQWDRLVLYAGALIEANASVNLISRKDQENLWGSHILHALALLAVVRFPSGARVMDLGTGGGLPGIPLAICCPDLQFDLVDSVQKKARAVDSFVDRLALSNVKVIAGRAEELKKEKGYQIVIARAVAPLVNLLKWTGRLLDRSQRYTVKATIGGVDVGVESPVLLAMKGGDLDDEIRQAKLKYPDIAPLIARLPVVEPGLSALDDKKVIIVPR